MFKARIRLFRVSSSRERDLAYPELLVQVRSKHDGYYAVVTLAEGLMHLRSTEGGSIIFREAHYSPSLKSEHLRPSGKVRRMPTNARLEIRRDGDEYRVKVLYGLPFDGDYPDDGVHDFTGTTAVELRGRMSVETVDLDVDGPVVR